MIKITCKVICDGCGKEADGHAQTKDPGSGASAVMFGMVAGTPKWDVFAPSTWKWVTYVSLFEAERIGLACSPECELKVLDEYKAKRAADAEEYQRKQDAARTKEKP